MRTEHCATAAEPSRGTIITSPLGRLRALRAAGPEHKTDEEALGAACRDDTHRTDTVSQSDSLFNRLGGDKPPERHAPRHCASAQPSRREPSQVYSGAYALRAAGRTQDRQRGLSHETE